MRKDRWLSRFLKHEVYHVPLIIWVLISVFPIVWVFLQSIKPAVDVFAMPPKWIFTPTLENYRVLFDATNNDFLRYLLNTAVISAGSTALALVAGTLAAYALVRFPIPAGGLVLILVLVFSLIPQIIVLVPLYVTWRKLSLLDTHVAIICTLGTLHLPFSIWMMRGFLQDIPVELEQAALVDGTTRMGAFLRVVVPLAGPGLAATSIFVVINSWNELLVTQILTADKAKTLPPFIASFVTDTGIMWGRLYAAGALVLVPVVLFSLFVQRHLVRGFTAGALKG